MPKMKLVMLISSVSLCVPQYVQPSESEIFSVSTHAQVEVSDGLTYSTSTLYVHPGKAMFRRDYTDRVITLKFDGESFWSDDGSGEKPIEGDAGKKEFIMGHQVHAWLLHFEELSGTTSVCQSVELDGQIIRAIRIDHERFGKTLLPCEGRPELIVMEFDDTSVRLSFSDWRSHQGVELPFMVTFDDGSRTFLYRYDEIVLRGQNKMLK